MAESALADDRQGARLGLARPVGRERLRSAATAVAALLLLVGSWELAKLFFDIKPYKLPHTYEIAGEFLAPLPGGGDAPGRAPGAQRAGHLDGGGALGFLLAAWFVHSPLMERGLLPYAIASQTVPIVAVAQFPALHVQCLQIVGRPEYDRRGGGRVLRWSHHPPGRVHQERGGAAAHQDRPEGCVDIVMKNGPTLDRDHMAWMMEHINQLIWPLPEDSQGIGYMVPPLSRQTVEVGRGAGLLRQDHQDAYTQEVWQAAHAPLAGTY